MGLLLNPSFIVGLPLISAALATMMLVWRHVRQEREAVLLLAQARDAGADRPLSLHPLIDPNVCIGSGSCVAACPEGDVLGMINGTAQLINASRCIGHGLCAAACPVNAIRLVFGTSERGVDLPDLFDDFETSRPGVHIIGELGGMGLIKNAIAQGVEMAGYLDQRLRKLPATAHKRGAHNVVDVAIVGGGPAGLATAVACRDLKQSFCVLEQGSLGGTIANYPRQKVIMSEPAMLPIHGPFGGRRLTKEELLEEWIAVLKKARVSVSEGVQVTDVRGQDGAFEVVTSQGIVRARKVVLALGRRGTPRKLEVPGEELPKVTYRLINPEQYAGAKVLIVGGGDAAMESAIMLAEETDAEITVSYRGQNLQNGRRENCDRIRQLIDTGRIKARLASQVAAISPTQVTLHEADGRKVRLANDYVLINIGGTLPDALLKKLNIDARRHFGLEPQPIPAARGTKKQHAGLKAPPSVWRNPWFTALFVVGAVSLAALTVIGWHYYALARPMRMTSPLHKAFRSSGLVGHGVGVIATAVMMCNFLYAVRKRVIRLRGLGTLRDWLNVHMLIGVMTPMFIAFHAAFQSNNLLASGTALSLTVVVATGLFGRFLLGFVPSGELGNIGIADLTERWQQRRDQLYALAGEVRNTPGWRGLDRHLEATPKQGQGLFGGLIGLLVEGRLLNEELRPLAPLFASEKLFNAFAMGCRELLRLRLQIDRYDGLRQLMHSWRIFHIVLSALLVVIIAGHIGVSLYLGYGWIFF